MKEIDIHMLSLLGLIYTNPTFLEFLLYEKLRARHRETEDGVDEMSALRSSQYLPGETSINTT